MGSDYQPGVTLITCTGDRPWAFKQCCEFVFRQTWGGPVQWIVVNDGTSELLDTSGYDGIYDFKLLYPQPKWQPGQNTLARNLLAAIPEVRYDKVLFIEDDDWYAADYVERMAGIMGIRTPVIAGNPMSRYYHAPTRRFRSMLNSGAASLCQTGISAEMLTELAEVCREGSEFIDGRLWGRMRYHAVLTRLDTCVGMKGLPGRPGIGIGHRPERHPKEWTADPDLSVLREWIGDDVELYREFL